MAGKIEIFVVGPGLASPSAASPGFEWINKPAGPDGSPRGLGPGPLSNASKIAQGVGTGFPPDMPTPILEIDKKLGRLPLKDFEPAPGMFWLVSDAAKQLLQNIDADAFVFSAVEIRPLVAQYDPGLRWFCDAVRYLDAIDESKSEVRVTDYGDGRRLVQIENPRKTIFRRQAVGAAHVFRSVSDPLECYCSSQFKDTVRSSGLKGLGFLPAGGFDA